MKPLVGAVLLLSTLSCPASQAQESSGPSSRTPPVAQAVTFPNGSLQLQGLLYKPSGKGSFPVVLFNHGSAGGLDNNQAFEAIAPVFTENGWAFFAPYRRGQGLSEKAGPYIMDEIRSAMGRGGLPEADRTLTRLLSTDHLSDQLAALSWLQNQAFVRKDAIAVMGNSFGGMETLLGAARTNYCAAVDASGGAESWEQTPLLRDLLAKAARTARSPVFFLQAENDFSLAPSRTLHALRQEAGLPSEIHIYPAFGSSPREGHSFLYRAVSVWSKDVLQFINRKCAH